MNGYRLAIIVLLVGLCNSCGNVKVSSTHMDAGILPRDHAVQKLIATEYDPTHEDYRSFVVSYDFRDGHFVSKDTLFGSSRHLSVSLHQGRYLVSAYGPVFDMATKKVIWESENGHGVAEARGDTVFYGSGPYSSRNGPFYSLDLKALRYAPVPKGGYEFQGPRFSPDNQKAVYTQPVGELRAHTFDIGFVDKQTGDTTFVRQVRSSSSLIPDRSHVTNLWLDNASFLYDDHRFYRSADNKGYHEVAIRRYDSRTGSDRLLCRIDSAAQTVFGYGHFRRDAIGQLHYRASNQVGYLLDTVSGRVSRDPFFYLNADFSYNSSPREVITIRYRDSILIDNVWASTPVATDYAIACLYWEDPQPGRYKGVKIWTSQTGDWVTFDVPWTHELVGWVEE